MIHWILWGGIVTNLVSGAMNIAGALRLRRKERELDRALRRHVQLQGLHGRSPSYYDDDERVLAERGYVR
jgi:hypothetical protein